MPDYTNTLRAAELVIRRKSQQVDATPFLAHCDLTHDEKHRFFECFKTFLGGKASRLPTAFGKWPLMTVWAFASALSEEYGDDDHAVYRVLNEAFGVELLGDDRKQTNAAFRSVCGKHGLSYEGAKRYVNDYLAQAGIARAQLHHVAKAFLFAERAFGSAPIDNTLALNSWEDDAASFLPVGVRIPRMVLEVDETAHYAFLFTRYRQKFEARNAFEELFFDELQKAENSVSGGSYSGEAVPRPSLVWSQNCLAVSIPKLEGRLSIAIGGEQRKLRGGQNWPLPIPWPSSIAWAFREHTNYIPILPNKAHVLAFDHELGRLVGQIDSTKSAEAIIDAREVMLVAGSPFMVDGQPAFKVGASGFASFCALGATSVKVEITSHTLNLTAKPKPRIWVESGSIAKSNKGHLLSESASIAIEFGSIEDNEFDIALTVGSDEIVETS